MEKIIVDLIDNLGHSLEGVRMRSLRSIITKLDLDLISLDSLLTHPKLLYYLINWLKLGSPNVEEILTLILLLAKKKDGLELLMEYDPNFAILSKSLDPKDFHSLLILSDSIDSNEPVKDSEISSPISSIKSISSKSGSSKNEVKKKKVTKCSFHSNMSSSQSVSASSLEWDRTPESPKNAGLSVGCATEIEHISRLSSFLPESDIKILKTVSNSLRDSDQSKEAVSFLSAVVFQDFPPHVFLMETSILLSLLKLAENESPLNKLVISCLGELTFSLLRYYHFSNDSHSSFVGVNLPIPGVLTMEDYCGLLLEKIGLSVPGLMKLLWKCVCDSNAFWKTENDKYVILKQGIKIALSRYAIDATIEKNVDPLKRLQAQIGIFRLLSVVPASVLLTDVQFAIQQSIFDPVLSILYPKILTLFRSYVDAFKVKNGVPYDDYFFVKESLAVGAKLLKTSDCLSFNDFLNCFAASVPSLEIHQNYHLINKFISIVIEEKLISSVQIEAVQNICLQLFSSSDMNVRRTIYKTTSKAITAYLGPHNSATSDPFPSLYFILNKNILREIIMYGASNEDSTIRESSQSALILILKCQMIVAPSVWKEIIELFANAFPLLHCLADMNTNFGRVVVSSLDPDVAKEMGLSDLDIFKGNIRLMMSCDEYAKDEGAIRIGYLLDIQQQRRGALNLVFEPNEGRSAPPANYEEGSLLRVLEVMKIGVDDVNMLKSAITQLSLMIEDWSLHILFLDNQGLEITKNYLKSSIESLNSDSSHFYKHSVVILKHIAESCEQVRRDCAHDLSLIIFVLKGVFLFGEDWCVLRDTTQLLFLIVFSELIDFKNGTLKFPCTLARKLKLPYRCLLFGTISDNVQPSYRGILKMPTIQKSLALQWLAFSFDGGVDGILKANAEALRECPKLLPVSNQDLTVLKVSSVSHNLKLNLENLFSAYSHSVAEDAIDELSCYLKLVDCCDNYEELASLPWETNFKRYLTTLPASERDRVLLINILRFFTTLLFTLPSQSSWISKIIKHSTYGFNSLLAQVLAPDMNETEKQLSLEILSLVEVCLRNSDSNEEWDYVVSCLVQSLSQSHTRQFYSMAITGKLLKCLLQASEKKILFKTKCLWKLLTAFRCPTPNSRMGISITRLSLLCLTNLLPLHSKLSEIVKSAGEIKWLWELLGSSDVIIKSAALELLGSLCHDSLSTEQILSISSSSVWDASIRILLDSKEPYLTRERAGDICNIIITNSANKALVKSCIDSGLFKSVAGIAAHFQPVLSCDKVFGGEKDDGESNGVFSNTPNLLTSCCDLCLNLIWRDRDKVLESIHSQGLAVQLFGQMSRWQGNRPLCLQELVNMYASICRLLVHCVGSSKCHAADCIPVGVWLLQDSSYGENIDNTELVLQSITLLSSIASQLKEEDVLLTKEAVKTICSSLTSSRSELVAAFSTALPPLTRFLDAEACTTIVSNIGAYNPQHRLLLSGILGNSNAGTLKSLECGFMPPLIQNLRQTVVNLSLTPSDGPRTKKTNATLNSLSIDFGLMTNFLAGSPEAKELATSHGLTDVLHKLWAWCLLDQDLLCSLLQVLITLTSGCSSACSSLVMTSNLIGVSQRKTSTSNSILHAALGLLLKEAYDTPVKIRILELATNACQATESRTVLVKCGIVNDFIKFCQIKWCLLVAELEEFWLQFMVVFTYYSEGQALMKNDELFSQLTNLMSNGRPIVKPLVSAIFRNLTFFHKNKQKLIVCEEIIVEVTIKLAVNSYKYVADAILLLIEKWLAILSDRVLQLAQEPNSNELRDLSLIVWYLIANCQRGKYSVHNASLDTRLVLASSSLPKGHPTLDIVDAVKKVMMHDRCS